MDHLIDADRELELPPEGHPLHKLGARLTELLDEDQWAACERLLLEGWAHDAIDRKTGVACDVVEARAAVAELIAAGDDVLALNMETDGATCEWPEAVRAAKRLRAAMARVRSS